MGKPVYTIETNVGEIVATLVGVENVEEIKRIALAMMYDDPERYRDLAVIRWKDEKLAERIEDTIGDVPFGAWELVSESVPVYYGGGESGYAWRREP